MKMRIRRVRHKLLTVLTITLCLGFIAMAYFYNQAIEKSILDEYQRTLHRLTDSVVMSIETIMTENHSEIMPEYAKRLKTLPGVVDLRIARIDGTEAFLDNKTISAVNMRLGEKTFEPRLREKRSDPVFLPNDPEVARMLTGQDSVARIELASTQDRFVQFFDTIPNNKTCARCHGTEQRIRGVVKVTASLMDLERDMQAARRKALILLAISLVLTVGIAGHLLGSTVAEPIESTNRAMSRISGGDFDSEVESHGNDEIGEMADSFNTMRSRLRETYESKQREKDMLKTVIQGAHEAVVVTNAAGEVVLINTSACELLGKTEQQIRAAGIASLVDQPDQFQVMLDAPTGQSKPLLIQYRERWLLCSASTTRDGEGNSIGSAALLRDVSNEQHLLLELQRLATTDALTDVYNRRHLDATLKTEMDRARQTGQPLSVFMIDVDHFKRFNDTYGHDQGDRVLKVAGQVMKTAVRDYDVPCRYGGEEFAVILPATDAAGALLVAERIRQDIESMRVDGLQVTISLGIACYPEISALTPEALIAAADAALYRSKENGRNCSTIAIPAAAEPT